MTIETVCPECGKSYRVRDEMAGKRFRCKACQSAVSIPVPPTADADDEGIGDEEENWDDDFLGGLDTAVKSERRSPAGAPPPIAGRSRSGSSAAKKKKSRSRSDEGDGSAIKMLVGLAGGAVGLVVGYLVVSALMAGGSEAPDWTGFTSPEAVYQAEFPAAPKLQPFAGAAPGSTRYVGETSQMGAAVTEAPVPEDAANKPLRRSLEQAVDQFVQQRPGATLGDRRTLSFGKHPALEFTMTADAGERPLADVTRVVLTGKAVFTLEFVAEGPDHAADGERFFNSFKLLGDTTAAWSGKPSPP